MYWRSACFQSSDERIVIWDDLQQSNENNGSHVQSERCISERTFDNIWYTA